MQKRLDFAKNYLEKGPGFWDHVIWSDETIVRSLPKSQDKFHKVHFSVKRTNLPVNPQIQNGEFSVMFWVCFSKVGLGPLVALDENLNSANYLNLLKNNLLPEIRAAGLPMVFMQDNAPCHKSRLILDFLAQENIETLPWPPQSPDLNPIENLWAIIKSRIKAQFSTPKTRDELIEQVFTIWEGITPELCHNLADSMKNRLKQVLERKGKHTDY